MDASQVPHLSAEEVLGSGVVQEATGIPSAESLPVVTETSDSHMSDPLTITKSIKVAANIEIPIHIPVAQPLNRVPSSRGGRRPRNVSPKQKMQPKVRETLRKIMPSPLPTVYIKTSKSLTDGQNIMENVMNDPTIQEMLKQNPGHTLTLVKLPDGQIPPIQLEGLPTSDAVLINNQPISVDLNQQVVTPVRLRGPGRPPGSKKRKRKKTEESDDEREGDEVAVQKVTRSGRVSKPPAFQGKYYVGLGGKSFKASEQEQEEEEEAAADENNQVNGVKQAGPVSVDPNLKPVKRGPGRPRKYPLPDTAPSLDTPRDPVPRSQLSRLAKQVSSWEFMLMRAFGQSQGNSSTSFYEELFKEFKTVLVNMRRLSGGVLQQIPESLATSEEDGAIRLSEFLSASLGQTKGLYKAENPSQEFLPKRVLNWLGSDAAVFPEKKDGGAVFTSAPLEILETGERESLPQTVDALSAAPSHELSMEEPPVNLTPGELAGVPTLQDPTAAEPMVMTQVQGALVPQGSVIMEMEDGTFMAQTPDGATMEIQAPENMTLETLSELLDQATGVFESSSEVASDGTLMSTSEVLGEKQVIPEDAAIKEPEVLQPANLPRTIIGNLQVKRSIELSKSKTSKPTTVLLQTS